MIDNLNDYLPEEMPEFNDGDDAPTILEFSSSGAIAYTYLELLLQEIFNDNEDLPTLDAYMQTLPPGISRAESTKIKVQNVLQTVVLRLGLMSGLDVAERK